MTLKKTPLAIFTYNRPTHTRQALEAVAHCARLDECDVIIFCDGLKKDEHRADVEATRQMAQAWARLHPAQVMIREQNLGLKKSIETGVGELCRQYGRVIVLEDDLIVSETFIDFMLSALAHYEDDARVMQVSGFIYPFDPNAPQGAMLLPPITSWGWATWWRAWQHYDPDPREAHTVLQDRRNAYSFDLDGSYPYTDMMFRAVEGKAQSWGIRFWYAVWQQKGLVVYPRRSLVRNIGFDGSGVNSGVSDDDWYQNGLTHDNAPRAWNFPSEMDQRGYTQFRRFSQAHFHPATTRYQLRRFWGRLRLFALIRLRRFLPVKF